MYSNQAPPLLIHVLVDLHRLVTLGRCLGYFVTFGLQHLNSILPLMLLLLFALLTLTVLSRGWVGGVVVVVV